MPLGKNIKKLRTEHGLTQDQLGDMLGVKKSAIQKYESGDIINLKMATIEKLANIFNVPPAVLVGWEQTKITKQAFEESVKLYFGSTSMQTLSLLYKLNDKGKVKVNDYVNDIYKIDDYRDR